MASVIILIGVPASGKSSLAEQMLRIFNQNINPRSQGQFQEKLQTQTQLISTDRIREFLYGSANIQGDWGEIWQEVKRSFAESAKLQQSIIYDATNYNREYRLNVIALAKEYNFKPITGLWLNVPLWICLSRNDTRDRQVPDHVIIEMYRTLTYAPPTLSEGFDRLLLRDENLDNAWID